MYGPDVPEPVFLNLEYIFFLFYRNFRGAIDYFLTGAFWNDIRVIATIIVILLIAAILYCLVRLHEIKQAQKKKTEPTLPAPGAVTAGATVATGTSKNEAWEAMRRRMLSDDEAEWRLGIIEADIMLDRVLSQKGYQGETLSDKLKQISPEHLASVQLAWEAHKVRNRIAHEGADYTLTRPEARKVLSYFEAVFRDLGVISEVA